MTVATRRWAVVLAAGRGQRFNASVPKQYQPLLGRTVLDWTLDSLLGERSFAGLTLVLASGDRRWRKSAHAQDARISVCTGGAQRELSLQRALEALAGRARDRDWIVVHDAARPCLDPRDLTMLLAAVARDPVGGLLATPVSDTLKKADDDAERSLRTVDRTALWRALTPQAFRYGVLRRALAVCLERGRAVTDEASAVEALGLRPLLVRGRTDNLKITRPEDLALAAAVLTARRRRA
jgi:2-C-methyl-D-erythritol 4-phosphate cytidylyltransferase